MFSVCVFSLWVCVFCVFFLCVFCPCSPSLCFLCVFSVCVLCLRVFSVFSLCVFPVFSLCVFSVFSLCVFSVFSLCFVSAFLYCRHQRLLTKIAEFLVSIWGEAMVTQARTISVGDVVQADNVILQRQTLTGTIAGTAEAGRDSKSSFFAWFHTIPRGPRIDSLQALTLERGDAISSAWAGSLSGGSSLRPSTGKGRAIVTCCSTAAACSMVAAESSDVVEIQLHGVWLVGVRGADVAYWACKNCKTKVDPDTGSCKKQSTHGCATEQEDSRAILATVHLADWTGSLENLLVNEGALRELTGFKTADSLLAEVDKRGSSALCFKRVAMSVSRRATSTSSGPAPLP